MRSIRSSLIMARTTLDLDASVLAQLRRRSKRERKSMGRLASEVLAIGLEEGRPGEQPPLEWARRDLGFKVDIDDKDALWRVLDADELQGRDG